MLWQIACESEKVDIPVSSRGRTPWHFGKAGSTPALGTTKIFCMSKTDIKTFEVTFLDDDINLLSDDLQYSTIGNGYGLQSNIPKNTVDYSRLYILCNQVRKELLEIKQLLSKYGK